MRLHRVRQMKGIVFLVLILVILISSTILLALSLKSDPVAENLKNDQVIKILFVMEDNHEALFTDVLIYYPVSRRGALVNILGNTGGIYSSLGRVDRIDAIYREKGMTVYKQEIEKLIGQPIPFSIVLKAKEFGELTDMLGGLRVFVPSPVDVTSKGTRWLLPSGAVTLDGDKIQTYLKYTYTDATDDSVVDRRQNVMVAFLSALSKNETIMFTKKNFPAFSQKLRANIREKDLFGLLSQIAKVDSERLVPQSITGSSRVVDGKMLLFPYYDGQLIKDVVKQTTNALVSPEETMNSRIYVLEIKNGTPTQGLARNTSALLQSAGYDVLTTLNADSNDYEETTIINHIGNAEVAKNLGAFIHCTHIVDEAVKPESAGTDTAMVDFTIILGKDFDGRYVRSKTR
jgi:polyisoprenyl-teichoic acid--peptidoglycan teichoic acid transferase